MFGWFKRGKPRTPETLRGAPEVRRIKSYQADSGYVYQYYFDGWRAVEGGREYVFVASPDRQRYFGVPVLVDEDGVRAWERGRGRELISAERHAVAKLALLAAFDERAPSELTAAPVRVGGEQLTQILATLGRD